MLGLLIFLQILPTKFENRLIDSFRSRRKLPSDSRIGHVRCLCRLARASRLDISVLEPQGSLPIVKLVRRMLRQSTHPVALLLDISSQLKVPFSLLQVPVGNVAGPLSRDHAWPHRVVGCAFLREQRAFIAGDNTSQHLSAHAPFRLSMHLRMDRF